MKIIHKTVHCACCGSTVDTEEIIASTMARRGIVGLDNKPEDESKLPRPQQCPECGYCNFHIKEKSDPGIDEKVSSAGYQNLITAESEDNSTEKRLKAMLLLTEDAHRLSYLYMRLCWHCEWAGRSKEADVMRRHAVEQMEKQFEASATMEEVLIYIDSLRQLGEFDRARETIQSVEKDVEGHVDPERLLYKVFQFEKNAVERGDSDPHTLREV